MSTIKTPYLIRMEITMLFNQFIRTITTPSMLAFYGITIAGAFFVSSIAATLIKIAPLLLPISVLIEENIAPEAIFGTVGILTVASGIGGYFGLGPAEVLDSSDEYILMTGPIQPHQLFLGRYVRRIVRKSVYVLLGVIIISPLIQSAQLVALSLISLVISLILFLEFNYFVGGFCSILHSKINERILSRWKHILVVIVVGLLYIPTLPFLIENPIIQYGYPSNVMSTILMEVFDVHAIGIPTAYLSLILLISFFISMLVLANVIDYDTYEIFAAQQSKEESESTFSRRVRGQVDFSASKFTDPMIWIMLKDFWSKMRTPLQFWKYMYVLFGVAFGLLINILQPAWLSPIPVPAQFSHSINLAFMLVLILMTQMGSLTSLLAFVEEKDNIYLLRSSPFRSVDIVLAKYILSMIEITLTSIPLYLFLVYFFRVQGSLFLISLAAPMIMIFSATGIMAGAYVPVFTNDPKNPPVPLAFSFPAINLVLGGVISWLVAEFGESLQLLFILPAFTTFLVLLFLSLSVHALKSYR